ncbi:hypothetical protein WJX84_007231 [Apatococcus fuscideae]|uniref:Uncharacterized protein n=1 Tax=Apatococcus fuscideae TaxID=2026836 RepID=A0AAW1SI15_9CHLO
MATDVAVDHVAEKAQPSSLQVPGGASHAVFLRAFFTLALTQLHPFLFLAANMADSTVIVPLSASTPTKELGNPRGTYQHASSMMDTPTQAVPADSPLQPTKGDARDVPTLDNAQNAPSDDDSLPRNAKRPCRDCLLVPATAQAAKAIDASPLLSKSQQQQSLPCRPKRALPGDQADPGAA